MARRRSTTTSSTTSWSAPSKNCRACSRSGTRICSRGAALNPTTLSAAARARPSPTSSREITRASPSSRAAAPSDHPGASSSTTSIRLLVAAENDRRSLSAGLCSSSSLDPRPRNARCSCEHADWSPTALDSYGIRCRHLSGRAHRTEKDVDVQFSNERGAMAWVYTVRGSKSSTRSRRRTPVGLASSHLSTQTSSAPPP
mmetsp:Transcript_17949/g.71946  ORF Transcript_17949/g.71946 Transcript_17949/m.71946 type:complete len:200 (+) Transcript_17949:626-1225(+)